MTHACVAVFTAIAMAAAPEAAAPPTTTAEPAVVSTAAPAPTAAPESATPSASASASTAAPAVPTSWDEVTRTTTVTTTTTTAAVPPPTVTPTSVPPPAPRPRPGAAAMLGLGGSLLGIGVVSLIFVAAPSAMVKRVALRRANDEDALAFSSREDRYRRARGADDTMEASFWIGVSALAVGVALVTAGAVLKARGPRAPRSARAPGRAHVRVDGAAGGLRVRF
jgi:hypothetical protein